MNNSLGGGETNFINSRGGEGGGFNFINCSSSVVNSNKTLMTIQRYPSGGYVGINTTSPSYSLDINGNTRCCGKINISNF